jgi:hypothetical protein
MSDFAECSESFTLWNIYILNICIRKVVSKLRTKLTQIKWEDDKDKNKIKSKGRLLSITKDKVIA